MTMKMPPNLDRRQLLFGLIALPVSAIAKSITRTPSDSEGPFYPTQSMRLADVDNDLVKIGSEINEAGGEIVRVKGRVTDSDGKAVSAAQVEIWQCDVKGRYLHHADRGWTSRDKAFQGFGFDTTNSQGEFSFRTIKPVPYSGRTPHIHLKVLLDKRDRLTTQLYLPDHPDNHNDWLYQNIPQNQRELVTLHFSNTTAEPVAKIRLVI